MSIWSAMRREVAGAWRSLCYDLRRVFRATARGPRREAAEEAYDAYARPGSTRVRAAVAVAVLAAGGAAAAYLGAVGGLAGLLDDHPPPAGLPWVAAGPPTSVDEPSGRAPSPGGNPIRSGDDPHKPGPAPAPVPPPPAADPGAGGGDLGGPLVVRIPSAPPPGGTPEGTTPPPTCPRPTVDPPDEPAPGPGPAEPEEPEDPEDPEDPTTPQCEDAPTPTPSCWCERP